MELFASQGTTVSIRQIAAAAGVSPGLVIHHFGSKDGLKDAVDNYAAGFVKDMLDEASRLGSHSQGLHLAELFAGRLEEERALAGYVRRLLYEGGEAGGALFSRLLEATVAGMRSMAEAGVLRRAGDDNLRAAVLLANDLAMILLRDQITAAIGIDPLEKTGLQRWSAEVIDIYTNGILVAAPRVRRTATGSKGGRSR
jgi:TetR/AcrR family transcriptional regulator, regulator of cefoperazone and chloramphenicol sensitivity